MNAVFFGSYRWRRFITSQVPGGHSVGTVLLDLWVHSHAHRSMMPFSQFSKSPDKSRHKIRMTFYIKFKCRQPVDSSGFLVQNFDDSL